MTLRPSRILEALDRHGAMTSKLLQTRFTSDFAGYDPGYEMTKALQKLKHLGHVQYMPAPGIRGVWGITKAGRQSMVPKP